MLSNKPYLVRAFYDWIIDSGCTPYLLANAAFPRCKVPVEFIAENDEITLNISPLAIRDLKISNEAIEFQASFSGVVHIIFVPIAAVLAIYAQENQQGMFFDYEDEKGEDSSAPVETLEGSHEQKAENVAKSNKPRPPHLRLVD